jgi:thiosulfate/3-mercaptopyruvate sulfurtransferase
MANIATVRSRIIDFKWFLGSMLVLVAGAILYVSPHNTSTAGKDSNSMLVSTSWLAEHLKDPGLVIITVGPRPAYDAGHIPGARYIEMSAISTSAPGATLEMPSVEKLKSAFEALGISNSSRIVICFLASYVSPSTRVYFTLDYLGLGAQTSLLDGGYEAWRADGKPVSTEVPPITRGVITPKPRPELIVDAAWVSTNTNKPRVAIVDARTPEFYSGANAGRMPRAGHIPGSVNIPFNTLADASNKLKDSQTLQKLLSEGGVKQGDQIVSYCHIGQQATVVYFVAKYLGYDARLYDGSFEDWSKRRELPVVGPK